MKSMPRILCIGGHDPSGGAGLQADIETVAALGGQAITLLTALTAQDTNDIRSVLPTPPGFFSTQAATLLDDIRPDAVKIGLLGSRQQIDMLARKLPATGLPVVLDTVLATTSAGEAALASRSPIQSARESRLDDGAATGPVPPSGTRCPGRAR